MNQQEIRGGVRWGEWVDIFSPGGRYIGDSRTSCSINIAVECS